MENRLVDIILKNMDDHKRDTNDRFEKLEATIEAVDSKLDQMLKFKYEIVAGTMVVSVILGVVFQIFLALVSK